MSHVVNLSGLRFIREKHVDELEFKLGSGAFVSRNEIAAALGIKRAQATALFSYLEAHGAGQLSLIVYHTCDTDVPILVLVANDPDPHFPFECDECHEEVLGVDELYVEPGFQPLDTVSFVLDAATA